MIFPEHMDRDSRNQRLYETLKGMGLFVVPIPDENDPSRIAKIVVSADLPSEGSAENPAEAGVGLCPKGSEIVDMVTSAERAGDNVIYLPTVSG